MDRAKNVETRSDTAPRRKTWTPPLEGFTVADLAEAEGSGSPGTDGSGPQTAS